GVDHPHARAAELLGDEQTDHTHLAQAVPHRVAAERGTVGLVLLADVTDRRLVGEEATHGVAQHLLVGTELEVHDAPAQLADTNVRKLPCAAMRLQYAPEDEAFRAELIAWLESHRPSAERIKEPKQSSAHMPEWAREWQRALFDAGYLVPGWPPALGGRNATATQQMIYFEEMSRREITRSANPQGLGIIAPSINDYGTPEQKDRFLLPTVRARIPWCLGMSEPGAGSDLASLKTRAELVGA